MVSGSCAAYTYRIISIQTSSRDTGVKMLIKKGGGDCECTIVKKF